MHKLIIVDDEHMMRDGLSNLINWKDIGFQVDAVLEDGKDAIEWLSENVVDVVLTDLRMTFRSGIDIAKFAYENQLDTKVIIISGYSDFEAAQEALKYKVSNYLLKPVSVKNIRALFKDIYIELKERDDLYEIRETDIKQYQLMSSFLENQFITNLALGAIRSNEEMLNQLKLIKWDKSIIDSACCIFELSIEESFLTHQGLEYDTQEMCSMLGGMITKTIYPAKVFWVKASNKKVTGVIVGINKKLNKNNQDKDYIETVLNEAQKSIKIIGIKFDIMKIEIHESLRTLSTINTKISVNKLNDRIMKELYERQQLMMSHILNNENKMVYELLESYIDIIADFDIDQIKNIIIDLFAVLNNNIRNLEAYNKKYFQFTYSEFFLQDDIASVKKWSASNLSELMEKTDIDVLKSSCGIIYKAKEYIKQNCCNTLSLNDVADIVFLSPVYLSKIFKEQTGLNFSEFLIECRILKACDLLLNSQKKVYEICNEIGYRNVKYFYNLFRRKMGCTPSEYRFQH